MDMKFITTIVVILLVAGCTTLMPIEMSPDELRAGIPAGELIQVGDSVVLTTADDKQHEFEVTSITDERIMGKDIEVPIADISDVKTREPSGVKTLSLMGGVILGIAFAAGSGFSTQ